MGEEYFKDLVEKLRKEPLQTLKLNCARGVYEHEGITGRAAQFVIKEKEDELTQSAINRNLKFSKNLVFATWGLVLVTALLVVVSLRH